MEIPSDFHFTHTRRVEFCETDMAGIMHFANMFRFVESAEHALFRSLGHSVHPEGGDPNEGWARFDVSCQYLRPARFEQILEVGLRIEEVRTCGIRYRFWTFLEGLAPESLCATGALTIIHVKLDPETRCMTKAPLPDVLRGQFSALLASAS